MGRPEKRRVSQKTCHNRGLAPAPLPKERESCNEVFLVHAFGMKGDG